MSNWRSPSRIRRQGREAFSPCAIAEEDSLNPYLNQSKHVWDSESLARDWSEGWAEAKDRYESESESEPDSESDENIWKPMKEAPQGKPFLCRFIPVGCDEYNYVAIDDFFEEFCIACPGDYEWTEIPGVDYE